MKFQPLNIAQADGRDLLVNEGKGTASMVECRNEVEMA